MQELAKYLSEKKCQLHGCSDKDIAKVEKHYGVILPGKYREFLSIMGRGAGDYMKGSSVFYDEVFDLREGAVRLLIDNEVGVLPEDTFVFWMHQGYQFAFFYLHDGDDPAVYFYYEGKDTNEFERKEDSLTGFFEKQILMSGL